MLFTCDAVVRLRKVALEIGQPKVSKFFYEVFYILELGNLNDANPATDVVSTSCVDKLIKTLIRTDNRVVKLATQQTLLC